jgi:hypothetical protein
MTTAPADRRAENLRFRDVHLLDFGQGKDWKNSKDIKKSWPDGKLAIGQLAGNGSTRER